jgi:hypothetical protein
LGFLFTPLSLFAAFTPAIFLVASAMTKIDVPWVIVGAPIEINASETRFLFFLSVMI